LDILKRSLDNFYGDEICEIFFKVWKKSSNKVEYISLLKKKIVEINPKFGFWGNAQ